MLEFITTNNQLLGTITIICAGLFAFIKWIDNRNNELKEKRYSKYMSLISTISGKREDGQTPNFTEQIAATWLLLEYKEYYKITEKIFSKTTLDLESNNCFCYWISSY